MTLLEDALGLLPAGVPTSPPDLDALICQLGVEVRYRGDLLAFNGSTDLHRDVPLIELAWVRGSDSPSLLPWPDGGKPSSSLPHQYDARTRFTLAHEFGHVLLDRLSKRRPLPASMSRKDIENVCDAIGAELLMPTCWFKAQMGGEPMLDDVRRTSLRARTSISSTVVRARNLGYGIATLHLSAEASPRWRVDRAYGLGTKAQLKLTEGSGSRIGQLPMKAVVRSSLDVACNGHTHRLQAEVRRTFSSAVVVVHRVDDNRIQASSSWRCRRA